MKKLFQRITALALSTAIISAGAFAQPSEEDFTAENAAAVTEEVTAPASVGRNITLQNGMRAVELHMGEDIAADGSTDLPALYEEIAGYGMNAVIIGTYSDGAPCFDLEINKADGGVFGAAADAAHDAGLYVYAALDIGALAADIAEEGGGLKEGFSAAIHRFTMKYACEGIILTDYYTADTPAMYAEYLRSGSGIGYTNWLYETNEYMIRTAAEAVRGTSSTTAVGLLISDMWANYTTREEGSVTADSVEALTDGFCDTKKYVEKGYADFVVVKAYGSTSDGALNFENVARWWSDLTESAGAKTYIMHLNEKIGKYSGWYEDQLLRQLSVMEDIPAISGSAFSSLSSLRENPLGTTDTLKKFFDEQINTDTIFEDLTMISPSSLSFVTYDSTVKFMGTFDENFDVLFDGSKIKLNEAGNFYFVKDLNVGHNSFTIEHKGRQYKYSIERRVDVLKSIESDKDVRVEGGTKISLVAVAYSGATVTATIGGKTIKLKEREGSGEELDANSSYAKFVGYYKVGEGIIGQEQDLGSISFYASYKGSEEYMTGGSVVIEAEPEPPKEIIVDFTDDQQSVGSGEIVGTMAPAVTSEQAVTYVKVLNNYTKVYDGKTTGAIPSPLFSQLPAGTLDYYRSSSDGYVTTTSGKRFSADDVTTFSDTGLGYNALSVKAIGNSGGKSFIKLHIDYKSSFNVTAPVSFFEANDGPYGVADFNADTVYITFDNITSVTGLPGFEYCTLFSAGKWETVEENGVPKFRLALTLRQAGIYSGCGAYYDENGDLMLTFNIPTASLSGKVIVIDPGHGYGKTAEKLDPGAIGNVTEQSVNLAVAKELESRLTEMGATVVRLKTESEFILTQTRPTLARSYGADMFISLHCNSALSTTAHGVEVYYFTPFSQPLASAINNSLSGYFDNTVYADGTSSSRGAKYSYYWVTLQQDFPSVLVEMGFISNERECMAMADSTHQKGMANAIANGVYAYFARSGLSYSGSGSDTADNTTTPDNPDTSDTGETTGTGDSTETPDTSEPSDTMGTTESTDNSDTSDTADTSEPTGETSSPDTSEPSDATTEVPDTSGGGIRVE